MRRLANPLGWYLDEQMVGAVTARGTVAMTWDEVQGVELARPGLTITGAPGTATVGYGEVASDPAALVRVLDFYRATPVARAELSDDRFPERLRRGDL